jgi:uncharacterized protein (DUF362 family)
MESRRSFIRNLFALTLLWVFGKKLRFRWTNDFAIASEFQPNLQGTAKRHPTQPQDSLVSVERCASYNEDEVYAAIRRSLDAIGYKVPSGKSVLLKPNILAQNKPEQCTTTHPAVVAAVCRIFAENKCELTIGESSAFFQGGGTEEGFVTSGIANAAEKYGAKLLAFESTDLRKITSGKTLNPFYITNAVFTHDIVVDLPKLKLHRLARYTGALKNTYGCVPGGAKQLYHKLYQARDDYQNFWGEPVVDVYRAVSPDLVILDGIIGLDKDGPAANGEPHETGVILSSRNGAALDITACRMIGFDPLWVPAVAEAVRRGMADPSTVKILGELPSVPYTKLTDLEKKTGLAKKVDDYMFDQLIVTPAIDLSICVKCNKCIQRCAPGAISAGKNGFPSIDDRVCIRCYCCEKYCPYSAITLQGGGVNHLIRAARVITGI